MKKFLTIAAMAAILAACSNDNEMNGGDNYTPLPIQLGTTVSNGMRSNNQTLQATELAVNQTVGVFVYYTGTTTKSSDNYAYDNIEYEVGNATGDLTLVGTTEPYYPESKTQQVDVYAFAPRFTTTAAELNTMTSVAFTTEADQTNDDKYNASDFVWGKTTLTPTTSTTAAEIPMTHMLSKINVNIAAGTGMTLDALKGATITLAGVNLNGKINLTDGSAAEDGTTTSTLTLTTGTADTYKGKFKSDTTIDCYQASAVIIPQTLTSQTLTIKLANNSEYTYSLSGTFTEKKVNTYDIKINATGLTLTTTITAWDDSTPATTGTAE